MKVKDLKKTVEGIGDVGCKIIWYGLVTIATLASIGTECKPKAQADKFVDYGDVVNAILDSDMFDSSKKRAISIIKPDGLSGYYRAIIKIVNSDLFDSSKMELIEQLCDE